jgi:hypothetical protein
MRHPTYSQDDEAPGKSLRWGSLIMAAIIPASYSLPFHSLP